MKKILAFAGSNSHNSINHLLLEGISKEVTTAEIKLIKLTDYSIPMYDIDIENTSGIPIDVQLLKTEIEKVDGLLISVNEHNGTVSAFFKNIMDWLSRADRNFLANKIVLVTSTSPGSRGAKSALEFVKSVLPRFGAQIVESFSFPSFQENFDSESKTITNEGLQMGITEVVATFMQELQSN